MVMGRDVGTCGGTVVVEGWEGTVGGGAAVGVLGGLFDAPGAALGSAEASALVLVWGDGDVDDESAGVSALFAGGVLALAGVAAVSVGAVVSLGAAACVVVLEAAFAVDSFDFA